MASVGEYTDRLLPWLAQLLTEPNPSGAFTNEQAAIAAGMPSLATHGVAFGNVMSRLDYSCYRAGLPPIGLTAIKPFKDAWSPAGGIVYPLLEMQSAARLRQWKDADFVALREILQTMPGLASPVWTDEVVSRPEAIRQWAYGFSLDGREVCGSPSSAVIIKCAPKSPSTEGNLLITASPKRGTMLAQGQAAFLWHREDQGGSGLAYNGTILSVSDGDPVAVAIRVTSKNHRPFGSKSFNDPAAEHPDARQSLIRKLFAVPGDLVTHLAEGEVQLLSKLFEDARGSSKPTSSGEGLHNSIRAYLVSALIEPARASGRADIEIRAGDIHEAMGLKNRLPAVCNVLRGKKLQVVGRVMLLRDTGPDDGPNFRAEFSFAI